MAALVVLCCFLLFVFARGEELQWLALVQISLILCGFGFVFSMIAVPAVMLNNQVSLSSKVYFCKAFYIDLLSFRYLK